MPVPSQPTSFREFFCTIQSAVQRSYDVALIECFSDAGVHSIVDRLRHRSALLVTTPTVAGLYGQKLLNRLQSCGLNISGFVLDCDENSKTLQLAERLCEEAQRTGLDRHSVIVGLGGGVCTDLVTMAASWLRRGVGCIRIPTTLIGQVDASIGIKGSLNFLGKKSALGCFYPPEAVFVDPAFLKTVEPLHLSAGLAEILKIALVRDVVLYDLVEHYQAQLLESRFTHPLEVVQEVVSRSVAGMLAELEPNLYEKQTYKRLVDFGHTFSPLLEELSGFRLSHGEAVAVDIAFCCTLAAETGVLPGETCDRILNCLVAAQLPCFSPLLTESLCLQALRRAAGQRGGAVNLVLLTGIGSPFFVEQESQLARSVIRSALSRLAFLARQTGKEARAKYGQAPHLVSRTRKRLLSPATGFAGGLV